MRNIFTTVKNYGKIYYVEKQVCGAMRTDRGIPQNLEKEADERAVIYSQDGQNFVQI
jgi:hypothetical protein